MCVGQGFLPQKRPLCGKLPLRDLSLAQKSPLQAGSVGYGTKIDTLFDFSRYRKLQEIGSRSASVKQIKGKKCSISIRLPDCEAFGVFLAQRREKPYASGAEAAVRRGSCACASNPDRIRAETRLRRMQGMSGGSSTCGISVEGKSVQKKRLDSC